MQIGLTIRTKQHQLTRQWRAWRSWLRRKRASVALLVLLTLGLGEPLLCIIHCQLWIPFALQNYFALHHHHHYMDMAGMAGMPGMAGMADASSMGQASVVVHAAGQPDGFPLYRGHASDAPIVPPPSPVHEVTLPLLALVLVVLLAALAPAAPLTGPPRVFIPVPLRPPIPIAG